MDQAAAFGRAVMQPSMKPLAAWEPLLLPSHNIGLLASIPLPPCHCVDAGSKASAQSSPTGSKRRRLKRGRAPLIVCACFVLRLLQLFAGPDRTKGGAMETWASLAQPGTLRNVRHRPSIRWMASDIPSPSLPTCGASRWLVSLFAVKAHWSASSSAALAAHNANIYSIDLTVGRNATRLAGKCLSTAFCQRLERPARHASATLSTAHLFPAQTPKSQPQSLFSRKYFLCVCVSPFVSCVDRLNSDPLPAMQQQHHKTRLEIPRSLLFPCNKKTKQKPNRK